MGDLVVRTINPMEFEKSWTVDLFIGDRIKLTNGIESEVIDKVEIHGEALKFLALLNEIHIRK
jgi:hypothetical protein